MSDKPLKSEFLNFIEFESNSTQQEKTKSVGTFKTEGRSVNNYFLLTSFFQIFLGLSVVALSVAGVIPGGWPATMMLIVGSISSFLGFGLVYTQLTASFQSEPLINKAIKRVVNFQN